MRRPGWHDCENARLSHWFLLIFFYGTLLTGDLRTTPSAGRAVTLSAPFPLARWLPPAQAGCSGRPHRRAGLALTRQVRTAPDSPLPSQSLFSSVFIFLGRTRLSTCSLGSHACDVYCFTISRPPSVHIGFGFLRSHAPMCGWACAGSSRRRRICEGSSVWLGCARTGGQLGLCRVHRIRRVALRTPPCGRHPAVDAQPYRPD